MNNQLLTDYILSRLIPQPAFIKNYAYYGCSFGFEQKTHLILCRASCVFGLRSGV